MKVFKNCGLGITIQTLDTNPDTSTYQPYKKPEKLLPHQKFQSPQTHTKRKKIINKKILQTLQVKYYKYQY